MAIVRVDIGEGWEEYLTEPGARTTMPAPRRRVGAELPTEHDEQAALFATAQRRARRDPAAGALRLLFAIPNGGARHPAVAAKLQEEGVQPGVPDLFLPVPRGGVPGCFIELKRAQGGRVAPAQAQWHAKLAEQGYHVAVCRGAAAAWTVLCDYLGLQEDV